MNKIGFSLIAIAAVIVVTNSFLQGGDTEIQVKGPDLKPIMKKLVSIRGLKFKQDVPGKHQSADDFGKMLKTEIDKSFPKDERDAMLRGLTALGLVKKKIDIGGEFAKALESQAAAYYDPEKNTFYYLMTDMPPMLMEVTAAHELVHALQDQHFDIAAVMKKAENEPIRNDDLILAVRCLAEGEATYVQQIYQLEMMGQAEQMLANPMAEEMAFLAMTSFDKETLVEMSKGMLKDIDKDGSMAKAINGMDSIPEFILEPLMGAYLKGAYFCSKVRRAKGWKGLDAAWKNVPRSAEQCLHPEKYLTKIDEPTRLTLPALPSLTSNGWKLLDTAIHGEMYLDIILKLNGVHKQRSAIAAAGWDGDIYAAYGKGDQTLIVMASNWDTPVDAFQFIKSWKLRVEKMQGKVTWTGEKDNLTWKTDSSSGRIVKKDNDVYVVESGDAALNESVLKTVSDGLIRK